MIKIKYCGLLFLLLLILSFSKNINAQDRGIVRGFVADSSNGEALPYANIFVKELNRGTSTDYRGYFVLASLPENKTFTLIFSYVGYKTKLVYVNVTRFKVTDVKVELASSSFELQTIELIGEKYREENAVDLSLQKITIHDLENLPKGVEMDIFRSLQSLPGVQTAGDLSSRYYVRGSNSNQNLVLLDNVTIYNPYHALGIFSAIDPDMVNSLEFFKGGFPAEYHGRLSSVLKVVTRDGNANKFAGKASVSLLTAKAIIEGPVPHGSFIISGRKNYSDEILKKFRNDNSLPADFYDFFFKVNYSNDNFLKDAKFTLSTFISNDEIMNNNPLREDFKWSNKSISFNYFQISDSPLYYQVEISRAQFKGEIIPNYSGGKYVYNEIDDVTMRMDFNYVYDNKDEMNGGFKIYEVKSKLLLSNYRDQQNDLGSRGTNISAYARYKFMRLQNFGADAGIRVELTRLAGGGSATFFEPRASITYRIIPELALKASWGIFSQDLVTVSDENEIVTIFEPWIITPLYLLPSSSLHYIGGIEFNPSRYFSISTEAYFKLMKDLAIVNERKFFSYDKDLIPGEGEAYGVEVQSRYIYFPIDITASYSLSWSYKNVNGEKYPPRYDSRHTVNLSAEYDFGSGWIASAAWTYSSGLPFTQIAGYYEKLNIDNVAAHNYLLESYLPFTLLGDRNIERLPDYHRLDLSLTKKIRIGNLKLSVDVSIMNAYNRKNLFYIKRTTGERVDMLPFLPSATIKIEL